MNITDVERYFNNSNLMESTVIQYVYEPHSETVTLVCEYADDVVQSLLHGARPPLNLTMDGKLYHRDLRRLIFSGVSDYERKAGTRKDLIGHRDNYSMKQHGRGIAIQHWHLNSIRRTGKFRMRLYLGDFGRSNFVFSDLEVDRRLVRAARKRTDSEDWDYVDIETMQPVDLYSPFES